MSDTAFVPDPRFAPPEKLAVRLVARADTAESRSWSGPAAAFLTALDAPKPGRWRVIGTAGSGVSALVVDAVLARMSQGVDPSRIVVLASSKESGAMLRRELGKRLPKTGYASDRPLVRSVHSFAFALVRLAFQRVHEGQDLSERAPRLINGAEHDIAIRELLQLQADNGAASWPENTREALRMVGFARQLRDFLLRAQERGLDGNDLIARGEQYGRPMWAAAGRFLLEYEEIMRLRGLTLLNASELVTTALDSLEADSELFESQAAQIDTIIVDDAQHLDPKAAELVNRFAAVAQCAIFAGNPDHTVFHFRGASAQSLLEFPAEHELVLDQRLRPQHDTSIRIADSTATELSLIADHLRRAHLHQHVAWHDMAVIVRSSGDIAPVRRALLGAGVPVTLQPTDVVLAQQRLVSSILLACRSITDELAADELEDLILGPVGGSDTVTLRRLLRGLRQTELSRGGNRRAIEVFREFATQENDPSEEDLVFLTDREKDILTRIRTVLSAGKAAYRHGESVEMILWEIWDATGLSARLMNASLRGGAAGSAADLDLDAVMALFDAAGDFVERHPTATMTRFVEHITEQELPTGARDRRGVAREAVALLTAHATVGMEWPYVVVPRVQEGAWPSLGETGSLFDQEQLVDLADHGVDPNVFIARTDERLAEERRLFGLATSRASESLLVTAVLAPEADDVDEPSRFLRELADHTSQRIDLVGQADIPKDSAFAVDNLGYQLATDGYPRLLSLPSIVAELRREVCDSQADPRSAALAAEQLAKLARAGIYGAHPDEWFGLAGPSTEQPLREFKDRINVSPSKIESGLDCPLRAALGTLGEDEDTPLHLIKGTLVHAAAEAYAHGVPQSVIRDKVTEAFAEISASPSWQNTYELANWHLMLDRTFALVDARTLVAAEADVDVCVSDVAGTPIHIYGRIDRLERNASDELVIVDIKTGKNAPSKDAAQSHAQLTAYQAAVHFGQLVAGDDGAVRLRSSDQPGTLPNGGGELVFPAVDQKSLKVVQQAPKSAEDIQEFVDKLPELVQAVSGALLLATPNDNCRNCSLKSMCPAQPEGRPLTHV